MKGKFNVTVSKVETIEAVQGAWPEAKRLALLNELLDDSLELSGNELSEMLTMALQDLDPVACGARLLEAVLGDEMSPGAREEVARDMLDGMPWERNSHMNWHRHIYEAARLAQQAHPSAITPVNARRVTLELELLDDGARAAVAEPMTPALAARLAAPCQPNGILSRLFADALEASSFPDACHVVWHCHVKDVTPESARLVIEGSHHWWDAAEEGQTEAVRAWPDIEPTDD